MSQCNESARYMERMEEMLILSHQLDFRSVLIINLLLYVQLTFCHSNFLFFLFILILSHLLNFMSVMIILQANSPL